MKNRLRNIWLGLLLLTSVALAGPGDRKKITFIWDVHPQNPWFNLYWSPTVSGTMADPDEKGTTWSKLARIERGVQEFTLPDSFTEAQLTGFFALTAENEVGESDFSNGLWVEPFPARPLNLRIKAAAAPQATSVPPATGGPAPSRAGSPSAPTSTPPATKPTSPPPLPIK